MIKSNSQKTQINVNPSNALAYSCFSGVISGINKARPKGDNKHTTEKKITAETLRHVLTSVVRALFFILVIDEWILLLLSVMHLTPKAAARD